MSNEEITRNKFFTRRIWHLGENKINICPICGGKFRSFWLLDHPRIAYCPDCLRVFADIMDGKEVNFDEKRTE